MKCSVIQQRLLLAKDLEQAPSNPRGNFAQSFPTHSDDLDGGCSKFRALLPNIPSRSPKSEARP